jgi:integrating conjugative element protein (TIGR03756 family)
MSFKLNKIISLLLICLLIHKNLMAETNSAILIKDTLKAIPYCLHYKIKGVCYWESPAGVNTTLYVEHYLPDVVVTVFSKPDENPWPEINLSIDKAGKIAQQKIVSSFSGFDVGSGQHSLSDQHEQNVFFKEADVIGNPALGVLPNELGLLPSTASPLMPYYQSMLDSASWRGFPQIKTTQLEEAYAMVSDIKHHIGTGLINWGGIYPHEGKVATSNDVKAAAVIAQRAGDLITSNDLMHLSGHIFHSLSNRCGQECKAAPIQENSDKTEFQMIYPVETDKCDYFGKTTDYGKNAETKTNGAYVWVIWRFYEGCRDGVGKFIGRIIIH